MLECLVMYVPQGIGPDYVHDVKPLVLSVCCASGVTFYYHILVILGCSIRLNGLFCTFPSTVTIENAL